jgi:hypothetical protein
MGPLPAGSTRGAGVLTADIVTGVHAGRVPGGPLLDDDVAARYGHVPRAGSPRWRRTAAAAALVVAAALFLWFALSVVDRDARWQLVSFVVTDPEHVDVTFEVYGEEGDRLRCLVRATSDDFADVGQVEVDLAPLPAGGARRETVTVRTIAPPANAGVRTCAVLPDRLS